MIQTRTFKYLRPASWMLMLIFVFVSFQCTEEPYEPDVNGAIKGQVRDAESGVPLGNVTITTQPATSVAVTGADGNYIISKVDTGEYSIVAEKTDYNSKILSVRVNEKDTSRVVILLSASDNSGTSDISFKDNFMPGQGAEGQAISPTLSWKAEGDQDVDSIKYDVWLYPSDAPTKRKVAENITDTSLTVEPLTYNSVYYWQVSASSNDGKEIYSKTMSFKTKAISENAFFFVKKTGGDYEIMAYDMDRDEVNPLTFNSFRDWAPKFNPKNGRIAYVSDSRVKPYIYTMDKNSGDIRQVSEIPVAGYHNYGNAFDWDEDRGKILFSHNQSLYQINSEGTNRTLITKAPDGRHFREVAVSPDGSQILVLTIGQKIYNSEIRVMDRDGSNEQVLIDSLDGVVQSPSWSIDGESILFTHDVSGNETEEGRMLNSHIFSLDLATNDTTDLSGNKPQGTNDMNPRYSPTGAQIIFSNAPNDDSRAPNLYIMDHNGNNREKIVTGGTLPSWE